MITRIDYKNDATGRMEMHINPMAIEHIIINLKIKEEINKFKFKAIFTKRRFERRLDISRVVRNVAVQQKCWRAR